MKAKIENYKPNKKIPFSEYEIILFIEKIEKIHIDFEVLFKHFLKNELSYITDLSFIKENFNEEDLLNKRIHHVFKERNYTKEQIEKIKLDLNDTIKEELINIVHYMIQNKIDFIFNDYNNFFTQNLFFSFKTKIENIIYYKFNKKKIVTDFKFVDYYFSEIIKIVFNMFHTYLNNHIKDIIEDKIKNIKIKNKIQDNKFSLTIQIDSFYLEFNDNNVLFKDNYSYFDCQNHLINGIKKEDNYVKLTSFVDSSIYFEIPLFLSYLINIKDFDIYFEVKFIFEEDIQDIILNRFFNLHKVKI